MRRTFCALATLVTLLGVAVGALLAAPGTSAATSSVRPYALGAFSGDGISSLESSLGSHLAISSSFRGWGDVFPDTAQLADSGSGHTLLVAWDLGDTADTRFTTFTSGAHDDYLAQEAAAVAAYGRPIYIRPWAEMNGDWVPFQPTADGSRPAGGTPAQFVAAWRYVVTYFRAHGAANARWVFNPTTDTYAETTPVTSIWPGHAYVDVLGLDGYNWGTGGIFSWRTFADVYTTQYKRLVALDPSLPVWVCEFATKAPAENDGAPVDPSHTKYAWYQGVLSWLTKTGTNVRAVVFFDIRKERDWRLAAEPAALKLAAGVAASAAKTVAATAPIVVTSKATARVKVSRAARATVRVRVVVHGTVRVAWARARASAGAVASATATGRARTATAAHTAAHAVAHQRATAKAVHAAKARALRRARAVARAKARRAALAKARRAARAARAAHSG